MDIFTEAELEQLIQALFRGHGQPLSREEVLDLVEWAEKVRLTNLLVEQVLAGEMDMQYREGQYAFRATGSELSRGAHTL